MKSTLQRNGTVNTYDLHDLRRERVRNRRIRKAFLMMGVILPVNTAARAEIIKFPSPNTPRIAWSGSSITKRILISHDMFFLSTTKAPLQQCRGAFALYGFFVEYRVITWYTHCRMKNDGGSRWTSACYIPKTPKGAIIRSVMRRSTICRSSLF